jgi:hypothetical protein
MVSSRFVFIGGGEFDRKKWDWQSDFRVVIASEAKTQPQRRCRSGERREP